MKILIGVLMGMLLGGGGVWASFRDPGPVERYEGVVNPLSLPADVRPDQRQSQTKGDSPCQR